MLWDVEWIDVDGTPLKQKQQFTEDSAHRQAQRWLKAKPGSRVYLYRRHGETSVLIQVLTAEPPR
jgi:hypothetical protein